MNADFLDAATPSGSRAHRLVRLRRAGGALLAMNFALFWAAPIALQGQAYKLGLQRLVGPIYDRMDRSLRSRESRPAGA